jgi:hypothetical protein
MTFRIARLHSGDLVEVKSPEEIADTLDAEGASDHLPFMPEMLEFCGQQFRIARRASTICFSGPGWVRGFRTDDVVTLEGVRCSGAAHDGCQKECTIFWREAWLRKVDGAQLSSKTSPQGVDRLRVGLKVSSGPQAFYCQASELSKVTHFVSRWQRVERHLHRLRTRDFTIAQMANSLKSYLLGKVRRITLGLHLRRKRRSTPMDGRLNLQPGEWVEVKSLPGIIETLDPQGKNRGLYFSPDMLPWCGRRCRVKKRLDRIIVDGTGEMRRLRDTVSLEGSTCGCPFMGFDMSGCSRCELTYWREIWLRRCEPDALVQRISKVSSQMG